MANQNLASFTDVKTFFKSWGLYPQESIENCEPFADDELSTEVIGQGINRKCYEKLLAEAERHIHSSKHGAYFKEFCAQVIDATDDAYYLGDDSWADLQEQWQDYLAQLSD